MELVGDIRVQTIGADGAIRQRAVRQSDVIAVVAVKQFRAPGDGLKLIVAERSPAQHEICSHKTALAFGEGAPVGLEKRSTAVYCLRVPQA